MAKPKFAGLQGYLEPAPGATPAAVAPAPAPGMPNSNPPPGNQPRGQIKQQQDAATQAQNQFQAVANQAAATQAEAARPPDQGVAGSNFVNFDRYLKANEATSNRVAGKEQARVGAVGAKAVSTQDKAAYDFQQQLKRNESTATRNSGNNFGVLGNGIATQAQIDQAGAYAPTGPASLSGYESAGMGPNANTGFAQALAANKAAEDALKTVATPQALQATLEQTYGVTAGQGGLDAALAGTTGQQGFNKLMTQYGGGLLDRRLGAVNKTSQQDYASSQQRIQGQIAAQKKAFEAEQIKKLNSDQSAGGLRNVNNRMARVGGKGGDAVSELMNNREATLNSMVPGRLGAGNQARFIDAVPEAANINSAWLSKLSPDERALLGNGMQSGGQAGIAAFDKLMKKYGAPNAADRGTDQQANTAANKQAGLDDLAKRNGFKSYADMLENQKNAAPAVMR